jgi:hypothetical protein
VTVNASSKWIADLDVAARHGVDQLAEGAGGTDRHPGRRQTEGERNDGVVVVLGAAGVATVRPGHVLVVERHEVPAVVAASEHVGRVAAVTAVERSAGEPVDERLVALEVLPLPVGRVTGERSPSLGRPLLGPECAEDAHHGDADAEDRAEEEADQPGEIHAPKVLGASGP